MRICHHKADILNSDAAHARNEFYKLLNGKYCRAEINIRLDTAGLNFMFLIEIKTLEHAFYR